VGKNVDMTPRDKFIIGIDASRNRSGGAKAHLIGVINSLMSKQLADVELHVWSYNELLEKLPEGENLVKHFNHNLEKNLFRQIYWQYFMLPQEARKVNCDIMLYTDAGAFVNFSPNVVMSRDMLSFELGEMDRYPLSFKKIRLIFLKYIQAWSLVKANGAIFLTNYAANVIQEFTGVLSNVKIIPHGVGENFRLDDSQAKNKNISNSTIKCIYVSNTAPYKHQWNVVRAIKILRDKGYKIELLLVGGGEGVAQKKLENEIEKYDSKKKFIKQLDFIKHFEIPDLLLKSDIFVFASSCENMPNTLIEGMAAGLKIACSSRGPMPEVLKDGGYYFDPESAVSISRAIEQIILNPDESDQKVLKAINYSLKYSWDRCAIETLEFLDYTVKREN
jgi:glycosyltransferase involved in cell wall biosynthesis